MIAPPAVSPMVAGLMDLLAGFGRIGRDRALESVYASERADLASRVLPGGRSAVLMRKERSFKRGLSQ